MIIFVKCLIAAAIAFGGILAACAAGVYVGIRQEELNQEDGNK